MEADAERFNQEGSQTPHEEVHGILTTVEEDIEFTSLNGPSLQEWNVLPQHMEDMERVRMEMTLGISTEEAAAIQEERIEDNSGLEGFDENFWEAFEATTSTQEAQFMVNTILEPKSLYQENEERLPFTGNGSGIPTLSYLAWERLQVNQLENQRINSPAAYNSRKVIKRGNLLVQQKRANFLRVLPSRMDRLGYHPDDIEFTVNNLKKYPTADYSIPLKDVQDLQNKSLLSGGLRKRKLDQLAEEQSSTQVRNNIYPISLISDSNPAPVEKRRKVFSTASKEWANRNKILTRNVPSNYGGPGYAGNSIKSYDVANARGPLSNREWYH